MTFIRVQLSDGREVPFDKTRVRARVEGALDAAGDPDAQFAAEVADVVEMTLERRLASAGAKRRERVLAANELEDLVEQALVELGRTRVVRAYILERSHRVNRDDARAAASTEEIAPRAIKVTEAAGTSAWSRARIVGALMTEADLQRTASEEVAERVEQRVFASGLNRITTALIRELVDNELVDMGLSSALRRQGPVGIPRHDLRRLLDQRLSGRDVATTGVFASDANGERSGTWGVAGRIASEVLRRFSLEDVFPTHVADLHLEGDLSIEDAGRPHLFLTQSVPCELLLRGALGTQSAFDLLDELARVAGSTSRGVILEGPGAALQPLIRGVRADSASGLGAWISALRALGRVTGQRFDLAGLGSRAGALVARLIEELARSQGAGVADDGVSPRLFLNADELSAALDHSPRTSAAAERLLRCGLLIPTWSGGGESFAGPGCHRIKNEHGGLACGGAVSLNLPRLARRAGPWREDRLLAELSHLVAGAMDAVEALSEFQARHRAARSGEVRGRVSYSLTPVGLLEALRFLGDGEIRPDQGARVLGFLADASKRFAAERGLSVNLSPFFGERSAARFLSLDSRRPRAEQGLLFTAASSDDLSATDRRYSNGFDLSPSITTGLGAGEGALLATVPTGALFPFPRLAREVASSGFTAAEGRDAISCLAAWDRFQVIRADLDRLPRAPITELDPQVVPTSPMPGGTAPLFSTDTSQDMFATAGGFDSLPQDASSSANPPEQGGDT